MASLALSALRRAALPRSHALAAARRGYAEAAASQSDKLRLSLVLPHEVRTQSSHSVHQHSLDAIHPNPSSLWDEGRSLAHRPHSRSAHGSRRATDRLLSRTQTIYQSQDVVQVNLSAESGDLGV